MGFSSLDLDIRTARSAKYENSQQEALEWVVRTLALDPGAVGGGRDLAGLLRDGVLLCRLGDLAGVANSPTARAKASKMPFVQMENISFFLQLCGLMGVPHHETFSTVDLFEGKDPYQVVVTLMAFSRRAHEANPAAFPRVLGPNVRG